MQNNGQAPLSFAKLPSVTIIILNWNGRADTLDCLASVRHIDYPNYSVLVVDNGSEDNSVDAIKNDFPEVSILETGKNLGYAGGNNVGMRWALERGADYILLLNNDTVVDTALLKSFVQCAAENVNGALFGAKIYYYSRPNTLWHAGTDWSPALGNHVTRGSQQQDDGSYDQVVESAYANGCALFAASAALREVGLFDESYFLIFEETDLSYRVKESGYKIFFVPGAKVWHKVSVSLGGHESPIARYFNARNQLLWASRHLGRLDRMRVFRHVLHRLRLAYIPPLRYASIDFSLYKRIAWGFSSWTRQFVRNLSAPGNMAELMGLRDYFLSRYGDCPREVRLLTKLTKPD